MAVATAKPNTILAAPRGAGGGAIADGVFQARWWILAGLWAAAVMEVLDTTIINVSLPQMAGNLGATFQEIAWVSTGYILANVVILPMTAFLAQRFGRKNYLLFSILLFVIASFFCGVSHSLGEIVLWRILQGAGGAALLSTAQATLRQIFPQSEQGIVQALFMLGIIIAPTLGPTLGGWITDNYTWSWCFFVNIPIGMLSLFLVSTFLHDPKRAAGPMPKPDWAGIGLLAVGLGSLQYVLEQGNEDDWFESALIVRLTIVALVALAILIWWQLSPKNPAPVVNLRVLRNKELSASLALFLMLGFGLYGGVYLLPLFTQTVLGFTPTQTGLALLPGGLATGVVVVICGALLNGSKGKVDPRILILIGAIIFPCSMWILAHLTSISGEPDMQFALIIRGIGLGFLFTPLNQVSYSTLRGPEIQQGSGLINLTRQMGGSFGIALLGTYVTNMTRSHYQHLAEYIYSGNPLLLERQQGYMHMLVTKGFTTAQAQGASLGMIARTINTQASTMSYNNAFLLIMVSFFIATPAIILLRAPKIDGPGAPADAH